MCVTVGVEVVNKASKSTVDKCVVTRVSDAGSARSSSVTVVHADNGAVVHGDIVKRGNLGTGVIWVIGYVIH